MQIGVPKEIKAQENRVGMTAAGVHALTVRGHQVYVQHDAGTGSGISDEDYIQAGARIYTDAEALYRDSELVVKVKEPLPQEYPYLRPDMTLFTYLHLAANLPLTQALLHSGACGIAYETVQLPNGTLPLLTPMSEVAGRMAVQTGAQLLLKYSGGMGILLGGVPGVPPAKVLIIGGGVVGVQAARIASGMGADVTVADISHARLADIDTVFAGRVHTLLSSSWILEQTVPQADLLIGAVLVAGAKAPKLVSEAMVKKMKAGSVIVDVAIDQGGCIETVDRVTTHEQPSYVKYGVVHYSVANMPGAVPRTSTMALSGATLPYILKIAEFGVRRALAEDPVLLSGLNTYQGNLTCRPVADAFGLPAVTLETLNFI